MEFNGFVGADFDFFRRKDKISKEEYDRLRNELKLHLRGLCYSLQKKYHSKTQGVLELQRDFQNFNKRSTSIEVEHICKDDKYKITIGLNCNFLSIELNTLAKSKESKKYIMETLKNKKNIIREYMIGNKFMITYYEVQMKNKKNTCMKLSSHDMSGKNYDNFVKSLEEFLEDDKYKIKFSIGSAYNKNECVKQGKNFESTAYESFMKLLDLKKKL